MNLFKELDNYKGAKFIGFRAYSSQSGEVSNYVVNCNISVERIKLADLRKLQNVNFDTLQTIADTNKIAMEVVKLAWSEMLKSAEKNVSANIADRTAQSQAQTDAYVNINRSIRVHKDTLAVHIFGMVISKKTLVKGEYKTVNSSDKTIAKGLISKTLKLSASKFRTFIVDNLETVVASGKKFEIS